MESTLLSKIMTYVDFKTLESMKSMSSTTRDISNNLHFKSERAITDLDRMFNIVTTFTDGNCEYKYSNGDNCYVPNDVNSPYEFFTYKMSLLSGKARCIEVPKEIYTGNNQDIFNIDEDEDTDMLCNDVVNTVVLSYLLSEGIKKGDVAQHYSASVNIEMKVLYFLMDGN